MKVISDTFDKRWLYEDFIRSLTFVKNSNLTPVFSNKYQVDDYKNFLQMLEAFLWMLNEHKCLEEANGKQACEILELKKQLSLIKAKNMDGELILSKDLSVRTFNVIKAMGINLVEDLKFYCKHDYLSQRGFGIKSFTELQKYAKKRGVDL